MTERAQLSTHFDETSRVSPLLVVQPCMPDIGARGFILFIGFFVALILGGGILLIPAKIFGSELNKITTAIGICCGTIALAYCCLPRIGPTTPLVFTEEGIRGPASIYVPWHDLDSYSWMPFERMMGQPKLPDGRNQRLLLETKYLMESRYFNRSLWQSGIVFSVEEQEQAREIFRAKGIPEV